MVYTLEDGKSLIQYIRRNLENYLSSRNKLPYSNELEQKYGIKQGAFVTLNKHNVLGNSLRGCIGMILPVKPLIVTVQEMSIAAAVEDPRFPKVTKDEFSNIIVEISILSVPEEIIGNTPEEIISQIKIGRDGLIIGRGHKRGLLLPQVPIDHDRNWDVETFLAHTCNKAWLPENAWKDRKNTKIEKFTATIFEELEPDGTIIQKEIGA